MLAAPFFLLSEPVRPTFHVEGDGEGNISAMEKELRGLVSCSESALVPSTFGDGAGNESVAIGVEGLPEYAEAKE